MLDQNIMGNKSWLCKKCASSKQPFHLAGILKRCALCGQYAYGLYEKVWDKWEPAILSGGGEN